MERIYLFSKAAVKRVDETVFFFFFCGDSYIEFIVLSHAWFAASGWSNTSGIYITVHSCSLSTLVIFRSALGYRSS